MVSTFPKMSKVELLVIEENLHRNTYLGGRSNQIDIFFKKKKKKSCSDFNHEAPSIVEIKREKQERSKWESLKLF